MHVHAQTLDPHITHSSDITFFNTWQYACTCADARPRRISGFHSAHESKASYETQKQSIKRGAFSCAYMSCVHNTYLHWKACRRSCLTCVCACMLCMHACMRVHIPLCVIYTHTHISSILYQEMNISHTTYTRAWTWQAGWRAFQRRLRNWCHIDIISFIDTHRYWHECTFGYIHTHTHTREWIWQAVRCVFHETLAWV
jgi:hypothetical protein